MFSASKQGYKAGYEDATSDKAFLPNRKLPVLKAIGSSNFVKTYIEGYKQGYREGRWKANRKAEGQTHTSKKKEITQNPFEELKERIKTKLRKRKETKRDRSDSLEQEQGRRLFTKVCLTNFTKWKKKTDKISKTQSCITT